MSAYCVYFSGYRCSYQFFGKIDFFSLFFKPSMCFPDHHNSIQNKILSINVKPNAKRTRLTRIENLCFYMDIAAPADKDKANKEVISFFSRLIKVPKSSVKIITGHKNRNKLIHLETEMSFTEIINILESETNSYV